MKNTYIVLIFSLIGMPVFAPQKQLVRITSLAAVNTEAQITLIYETALNTVVSLKEQAKRGDNLSVVEAWTEFTKLLSSKYIIKINSENTAAKRVLSDLGLVDDNGYLASNVRAALCHFEDLKQSPLSEQEDSE